MCRTDEKKYSSMFYDGAFSSPIRDHRCKPRSCRGDFTTFKTQKNPDLKNSWHFQAVMCMAKDRGCCKAKDIWRGGGDGIANVRQLCALQETEVSVVVEESGVREGIWI